MTSDAPELLPCPFCGSEARNEAASLVKRLREAWYVRDLTQADFDQSLEELNEEKTNDK